MIPGQLSQENQPHYPMQLSRYVQSGVPMHVAFALDVMSRAASLSMAASENDRSESCKELDSTVRVAAQAISDYLSLEMRINGCIASLRLEAANIVGDASLGLASSSEQDMEKLAKELESHGRLFESAKKAAGLVEPVPTGIFYSSRPVNEDECDNREFEDDSEWGEQDDSASYG